MTALTITSTSDWNAAIAVGRRQLVGGTKRRGAEHSLARCIIQRDQADNWANETGD